MAINLQTIFSCAKCGAQFSKWNGRCFECGGWGTLKQEMVDPAKAKTEAREMPGAEIIDLEKLETVKKPRISTGLNEVDRVLGGGFVPGSLVLLSGEPGIGKSTIISQIADGVDGGNEKVIYVSGEESAVQVRARFERLGIKKCTSFIGETNIEKIISSLVKARPRLVIVDSIQTVYSAEIPSETGNLSQIRGVAVKLLELAKEENISVVLVGHITKDGQIAGPKTLEHIVDTVLYLESEKNGQFRLLRATKNRFGSTNEVGVFEMTPRGFREISEASSIFLDTADSNPPGSVISCIMEGSRPFLVEIQALVTKTVFGYPQRKAAGFDLNRLQILAAVLSKRAKINLLNQDVLINVAGGVRVNDTALDLAVCLAISSALLNQKIDRKTMVLGEVGLGGELRNISQADKRIATASKLGFEKFIIPDIKIETTGLNIKKYKTVSDIIFEYTKKL